jgi:probable addiction module antidote protein
VNTVFIGGSRHVSRLNADVQERLQNVTNSGARVIVGDANGADKAVQKFLMNKSYDNVTVFCSGDMCRNNLGRWQTRNVRAGERAKGFDFYAAKDREMAREADYGLMIWDGKSVGTVLNILRLVREGKKAVLLNVSDKEAKTFKTPNDWSQFYLHVSTGFKNDLRKRATPDEWIFFEAKQQPGLFDQSEGVNCEASDSANNPQSSDSVAAEINAALAAGDAMAVVNTLGNAAKARGMSQVAKDAGLARESLYRSLGVGGNPEFMTVLKVISAMGLRLMVGKPVDESRDKRS